jgi:nitrogenase-stabilizing/protective protein
MSESEFELDMEELTSAEDFLDYFGIDYVPSVVHVNRLHILQRFHDYMSETEVMPKLEEDRRVLFHDLLAAAYQDFVDSDALTEKVFKVFRMKEARQAFVSLDSIGLERHGAPEV